MKTTLTKALALAGAIFLTAAAAQAATFTRPVASEGNYSSYVYLRWSANSYANYGYYVYRTTTPKFTGAVRLGRVTSRACVDRSARIGTAYWYWIAPIRRSGSRLTWMVPKSGVAATTAQRGWRALFVPKPYITRGSGGVYLQWSASSASKRGYDVYRGTSTSFAYSSRIGRTTGRAFYDTSAYPGRTYYYWIVVRGSNFSWYDSNKRAMGYRNVVVPQPHSKWIGNNPLYIYWTASYGAKKYQVFRGRSKDSARLYTTITGTSFYDYNLPYDGLTYYYWICPIDIEGDRWWNWSKYVWAWHK